MNHEFYKRLLDHANDLIWATDMEGRFIYINDNIRDWGYDKDELIGQPLLKILNANAIGKRYGDTGRNSARSTFEMEVLDKRGEVHQVAVSSSPLPDDKGNIVGVMGIIRDISETQGLEQKLKNEERLASLGRLATGIAHEIRNPLSSVKMNLAILRKRLMPQGEDEEHFSIAQEEVSHLGEIVNELVDYAKPKPMKIQSHHLQKPIDDAIASARAPLQERGVTVRKEVEPSLPLALIDRRKIHQATLNLLLNAIEASPRGGEVVIRALRAGDEMDQVRIEVVDQGSGINDEEMKFIFDPFFTTRQSGTGMGLAIVSSIMAQHDGKVSVESEPGKMTCVRLDFLVG